MATIEHNGMHYEVDEEDFLLHGSSWNENWIDYVRGIEGINDLTDNHQKVINAIGWYRIKFIEVWRKDVLRETGFSTEKLIQLFGEDWMRVIKKISGLPNSKKDPLKNN